MTFDRSQFREIVEKKKKAAQANDIMSMGRLLSQAEVDANNLTADPKWNIFLQFIQAAIERMETVKAGWDAKLHDNSTVDPNLLMAAKMGWHEADAAIRAWQSVLAIPKDIQEAGEQARDVISRFELEQAD